MTLDLTYLQIPGKTLVLILGASKWPETHDFTPSSAFANAAQKVQKYFTDYFKVPKNNLLSLFDEKHSAQDMYKKISEFLQENAGSANQVITYCIGHGQMTTKGDGLYLPIRKTQQLLPEVSSLNVEHLMKAIKVSAPQLKRVYILDCCFAGKAFSLLQSGMIESNRADDLLSHLLRHANRSEPYAALFASGPDNSAILLPDETNTFFTEAFLQVVTNATEFLSLYDIKEKMKNRIDNLFKIYDQIYTDFAIPPLPQIYESEVAQLPLFPGIVIQTDQLITEITKCLAQTAYREIRLIYCDPPTRTVRVLCSEFQGDQDFHCIFQQIEETTGWRVKVDVWEELAPIIARPTLLPLREQEYIDGNGANGQGLYRKTNNRRDLPKEETDSLGKDFKETAERLVHEIGRRLQTCHYQPTQTHFHIVVPGVTETEKQLLKVKFQNMHRGYTLGIAAHP
jgi:hypothetical protein